MCPYNAPLIKTVKTVLQRVMLSATPGNRRRATAPSGESQAAVTPSGASGLHKQDEWTALVWRLSSPPTPQSSLTLHDIIHTLTDRRTIHTHTCTHATYLVIYC